jgi:hypothetical protein
MAASQETGQVTGTKDKVYNLVWFTEASLRNALQLEAYIADAERDGDEELAEFFRKAQRVSRKGGELGKSLLASRLAQQD